MEGLVYKITNKINNKAYIGITTQSISERWSKHCTPKSNCTAISSAIKKYGKDSWNIEVLETVNCLELLKKKESYYIHSLNTIAPFGYNLTFGGEIGTPSIETREKIANSLKGRKRPPEIGEKVRLARLGKKIGPCSEQRKQRISASNMGKIVTKETRKKISLAKKGVKFTPQAARNHAIGCKKNNKKVRCLETKKIFSSVTAAAKWLGLKDPSWISKICRGKQKTAKGFSFKYVKSREKNEQV